MNTASTTVDLSQILSLLLQALGIVLAALATWAGQRLISWLNLKVTAGQTAQFNDAIQKSMTYGLGSVQSLIVSHGWDHPDVKTAAVAQGLDYAASHFPAALKAAGVDLSDSLAAQKYVTAALDRSFPEVAKVVASSPATPPVPPNQGLVTLPLGTFTVEGPAAASPVTKP